MVTHWGMSDILGPMSFRVGEEHVFLGKELQEARDFSDQTAYLILSDHRPMLERMVGALLEKEELLKDDIQEICGKRANGLGGSEAPPNGKANTAANSTSIRAQE